MVTPGQFLRILTIQRILIRHGLDEIILATHLFRPVRFLLYLLPWNWMRSHQVPRAERLRRALEDLGPIFVKFGQLLSTRRDLLPDDIVEELARLQDSVPPFPGDVARQIIEKAYGHGVDEVFVEFNETPLASASIAQVHAATLRDGREMIVKVVRPGIEKGIRRDVGLLFILADMAEHYWRDGKYLRPTRVVAEFEKTLLNELDLMREAANASQLRRNFAHSEQLYVPEVDWGLTRRNVMVMERISGIPVSDIDGLKRAGIDLRWLAEAGVESFFTQVFRDSFFHADMHPGNIFVTMPDGGQSAKFVFVDFGIMGSLSEYDQRYLAENFLAFLKRDYRRVAELHVESGWVPLGTRVDEFEFAIRTVCEPLFERPLKEISFGRLLFGLFQTARRFNMEILPQMILLQKTLVNIEGLGRQLYPDLDLWQTARPLLERWMGKRVGVRGLVKSTRENFPLWVEKLPDLPNKLIDLVERARNGKLQVEWHSTEIERLRREIRQTNRRSVLTIIASAFIISAALVFALDGFTPTMLGSAPVLTWLLGGLGVLMLLVASSDM